MQCVPWVVIDANHPAEIPGAPLTVKQAPGSDSLKRQQCVLYITKIEIYIVNGLDDLLCGF